MRYLHLLEVGKFSVISFGDGSISDEFQITQCLRKYSSTQSTKSNPVLWKDPVLKCLWFTNTNCCNLIKYGTHLLVCRRPDLTCVDSFTELSFNDKTPINSIIHKADAPLHMEQISDKLEAQMVLSSLYGSVCALEHLTGSSWYFPFRKDRKLLLVRLSLGN